MDTILSGLTYLPEDKSLLLLKGRTEASKSPDLALSTFRELSEMYPEDSDIKLELANILVGAEEYDEGISLLKKLTEDCSDNCRRIELTLAAAYYKNNNKNKAGKVFEELYSSSDDAGDVFLTEIQLMAEDGQWNAIWDKTKAREDILSDDVLISAANRLAGREAADAQEVSERILNRVTARTPQNINAQVSLGMLMQMKGRHRKAVQIYTDILKKNPDAAVITNNLAWLLCEQLGEYEKALKLTKEALEKNPEYADLIDTQGVIHYRLKEYDKSQQDLERCLDIYLSNDPSLSSTYFHLGRTMAAKGEYEKAAEKLNKALELNKSTEGLTEDNVQEIRSILDDIG